MVFNLGRMLYNPGKIYVGLSTYSKNMVNYKAFHQTISWSINLLFLKSDNWFFFWCILTVFSTTDILERSYTFCPVFKVHNIRHHFDFYWWPMSKVLWPFLWATIENVFLIWIYCSFKKGASDNTISYFDQSFRFSGLWLILAKDLGNRK